MTQPTRPGRIVTGSCCPGMRPWCSTGRCTWPATTSRWRISARFASWGRAAPGIPSGGCCRRGVTTGPLGQGVANAVGDGPGRAAAGRPVYTEGFPLVDHRTIAECGDGAMMEGVASEACSLAGHLGLGELTLLYDDNRVSLLGVVFPPSANPTRRDPATGPAPGRGGGGSPFGWSKLDRPDGGPDHLRRVG
jgi:Transketolase, thiamine diphosphate binding domain